MTNWITKFWTWLFPKPEAWVVSLCRKLKHDPGHFSGKSLGEGFYSLSLDASNFTEEIVFSFEASIVELSALGAVVELNRVERSMLMDAIEDWANSKFGEDLLGTVEEPTE